MMRYLVELNHPKHYYQFREVARQLRNDGHEVHFIARDKDVLLKILEEEHVDYELFGKRTSSVWSKAFTAIQILWGYIGIVRRIKPDMIISKASLFGTIAARLCGCKSVIFPDSEVVKLTNKVVVPMCTAVVTPASFGLDYGKKHFRVKGFFENCYLSPSVFSPDASLLDAYGLKRPYAIFRFIGWTANHDIGQSGLTLQQKLKLVESVSRHMSVYISSEKELPAELLHCQLHTPPSRMHDVLAMADLYVGDSQTMATEAALLGTPAIRSNSWVGPNDMTNFQILEKQYHLLINVAPSDEVESLAESFASDSRKAEWQTRVSEVNTRLGDINLEIVSLLSGL